MPGSHVTPVDAEEEVAAAAHAAVTELAARLVLQTFPPLDPADPSAHSRDSELATLRALAFLQRAVERAMSETAARAAHAGAGYPQLGQACRITRQGARRRWPGLAAAGASARVNRPGQTPSTERRH
ncbi:MAG TPA: hypothetical protein VLH10_15825 [Yinghuangia sp.]|uniref:hypothetical protein n=1 Tax=Yinghuangia sp. YIM S10712 TaxID=3436930 RepID=UPI002B7A6884|nr:hypothetical protein [Yinghuangia sp.]